MGLFTDKSPTQYDAIVVGTGITGGWAAKELCEAGLKTLVLERGRNIPHLDYPTANKDPWDFENGGYLPEDVVQKDYPKQNRTGYTVKEQHVHHFVKDSDHPYEEEEGTRFDWIRGYQVGGRSLVWGRQSYRWSDLDFESNAKEGIAVDWPIRYKDLAPWYDKVERFAGISGRKENLPQLPDGEFLRPMEFNCVEEHLRGSIDKNFPERRLTIGRTAHITSDADKFGARGQCQTRDRCMRGCPFGAYFSSNASTLPAAEATGNMTLRPFSIAYQVIYDDETNKATGVRIIDAETKKTYDFTSKVIFLCASCVPTTSIMMQSTSSRFPDGLGNESGELGHNMMDHHFHVGAWAQVDGYEDQYYIGRRPNGIYVPRFRNLPWNASTKKDYLRGFGYQGGASRGKWWRGVAEADFGGAFKDALYEPGGWSMNLLGFGEMLPYHENKMWLTDKKDQWGLPILKFATNIKDNELKMRKDMQESAMEMLDAAGYKNIQGYDNSYGVGLGIHEMGTARMGNDPKTSVLNKWNQVHGAPNVYVTDGACMTSAACVNPSLTYMALTARAANHAVSELKKGNL